MLRQGNNCEIDKFELNAQAVLEHMFNNHQFHNPEWFNALREKAEKKECIHPSGWLPCSDAVGLKIHGQLKTVDKYRNDFYFTQSMHPFTTQTNEARNNSQSILTPKNKIFYESRAFHYLHAIVVGSHN